MLIIEYYVKDKDDFGVASAIMLGYRDYINPEIMRAYAGSGALHVLSVSGLHVGVVFVMLNFLLGWMDNKGRGMVIAKAVIVILFIWFYACLTGLSPPVLRSALMFSLIQIGRVSNRNVNTYNIIAGSAILILVFNPFALMDVGFQLSYLAVIGIIYMQPLIAKLIPINVYRELDFKKQKGLARKLFVLIRYDSTKLLLKFLNGIWQLTAVSLAAQIVTLPLSILYFYQFPNLFLISNLVVIPLSDFVLFSGTPVFVVARIPYLGDLAGWIFSKLLACLNGFIFWIDGLPHALIQGIVFNSAQMILLYLLIFLLCILAENFKPKILIASLCLVFCLCSFHSYQNIKNAKTCEIAVYDISKQKAVALIESGWVLYDIDSSLWNNQAAMNFHIRHHWWNCGVMSEAALNSVGNENGLWVLFHNKTILMIDSTYTSAKAPRKTHTSADIVIISGSPKIGMSELKQRINCREVVFDSSNKNGLVKKWVKECVELKLNYWDVGEKGAFIQKIEID